MPSSHKPVSTSSWISWLVANCSSTWGRRRNSRSKEQSYMLHKLYWHWTISIRRISSTGISNLRIFWWEQMATWKSQILDCRNRWYPWVRRAIPSVAHPNILLQRYTRTEDTISPVIGGVLEHSSTKWCVVHLRFTQRTNRRCWRTGYTKR